MNSSPLRRRCSVALSLSLLLPVALLPAPSAAQSRPTVVQSPVGGQEFRYLGDTIWSQRDTTMTRAVYRADTAIIARFMHGRMIGSTTYLLQDGMARIIELRDSTGAARALPTDRKPMPAMLALGTRAMLESTVRSSEMRNRLPGGPSYDVPRSPSMPTTYALRTNGTAVHHGDTIRITPGCPGAAAGSTTTWLLFGNDSVKRLSPSPRTFDRYMVMALLGELSSSVLNARVREMRPAMPLPGPTKGVCVP
ncbi:MAG TPA: hypothetical protein VE869_08240 [Gemmatimonas sp.]|nr:hypothetical protein [Gemmatimonas sp.]